jgi:hypothetical protein
MSDTYVKVAFQTDQATEVRINTAYFPGWQYIVNVTDTKP